jgi:hypothetical protein
MIGDLGDGQYHAIPVKMVEKPLEDPDAIAPSKGLYGRPETVSQAVKVTPHFSLDYVHKIELKDERPRIPKKAAGMSDAMHGTLCDAGYKKAAEAKAYNDRIRAKVYHYVEQGALELVSDPFAGNEVVEGFDLYAELLQESQAKEGP